MDYNEVLDLLKEEELVKFTRDLVRIKSVYDPSVDGANEAEAASFVYNFLEKEGFEVYMEEVVPGRPNVIAFLRGKDDGKTLLFEGHTDVVTAGDLDAWNYDPFGAEVVGDRMYGRGTCDTKGNLAAAIFATKAIKDSQIDFKGNILLCIPCDEEGMMIGIKDFIKRGWADNVDRAIICEPEENMLCLFQKGAIRAEVRIYGKQSHGCMPLSGINPNWRLARLIIELEKLEQAEKERVGKHEYLGWPSITPTVIMSPSKGEPQINVVPGEAYMALDIRTIPGQNHGKLKEQLKDIYKKLEAVDKDFSADLEIIEERPWTKISKEDVLVKCVAKAYRKVMGKKERYSGVPGATDGTFLDYLKGIPVLVIGAGNQLIPHHADEYVDIPELIETAKIYILSALYFLGEE
ncbi:MAG TPA: M20 family metallopeptidase [Anaerovoracaceae bacterium]|nr:M20 family metallopeptidase [Anaerovoracaceae bacterium]